jgi:small subunit ribosomal protein S8
VLTRIRNAHHRSHPEVTMPASKLKASVAQGLQDEGYIGGFSVSAEVKPSLTITLKYFEGQPVIEEITRISKPSLRKYVGSNDLPKVRSGLGIAVVSTSKGVMTDRAARAAGIGGEVLCTVF